MSGDRSLSKRPMQRVIDPLTRMGARIRVRRRPSAAHHPRRRPSPDRLRPDRPQRAGQERRHPRRPADRGAHVGARAGADPRSYRARARRVRRAGRRRRPDACRIEGGQRLQPVARSRCPGDISSATFWMALAAGTPGGAVEIEGVGLNPSRTDIVDLDPPRRRRGRRRTSRARGDGEPIGRLRVALRRAPQLRDRAGRRSRASSTRFRRSPRLRP